MTKPSQLVHSSSSLALVAALIFGGSHDAQATTRIKQNNTINLNLAGSWNTLPTSADIASWDSTVTAANTTVLGADLTWQGILISGPVGLVTINAGNTLTIGAAGTDIDMAGATADLTLNCAVNMGAANLWSVLAGRTLTIGGAVGGTGTVTKLGNGTVILGGVNTYATATTIQQGTFTLNGATGSINDASTITFTDLIGAPAVFNYDNVGAGGSISETVGALTFTSGQGEVRSTRTANQNTTLIFASVARTAGATGNITYTGANSSASANRVTITGLATGFGDQGVFLSGTNYVYNDSGGFLRAPVYGTDPGFAASSGGATIGAATGSHVNLTGNVTAQTTESYVTLRIDPAVTLALASGQTLTLTKAGLLKQGGGAVSIITNGTALACGAVELVARADSAADSLTIYTPITGSGGLTKAGVGRLTLNGSLTSLTGSASVLGGILTLGTSTAATMNFTLKRPDGTTGGAAIELNGSGISIPGTLSVAGAGATVNSGALRNISGNNSWNGGIVLGNSTVIGSDAGTLTITGGVTGNTQPLNIVGAGDITFSTGIIATTTGGVTKLNGSTGTLTMGATAHSFTGNLGIRDGTVSVSTINLTSANGPLGRGTFTLGNAGSTATLKYTGATLSTARAINIANGCTGAISVDTGATILTLTTAIPATTGTLTKTGPGVLDLTAANLHTTTALTNGTIGVGNSSCFNTTGTVEIYGGKLANDSASGRTIPVGVALNINADFTVDDTLLATANGQILFNGPITLKNGTRTITVQGASGTNPNLGLAGVVGESAPGTGLIKNGLVGTIALNNAANTYSGDTTINAGTININGASTLGTGAGTLHLSGGKLQITASRTVTVPNPLDVTADSILGTSSAAATVDCDFTTGTITAASGSTLTIRNDATSGTGVWQPRFSGSGFNYAGKIAIVNGSFGTTALHSYNTTGTDQTFSNEISGTGSYTRNASTATSGGRTIFTAANIYSGGTSVSRGTLLVNNTTGSGTGTGPVSVGANGILGGTGAISGVVTLGGGTLSPGASIGTLTLGSAPSLSGGTIAMEINKTAVTVTSDKLVCSGVSLAYGGTLTVTLLGGSDALTGGETFDLFDATGFTGSFAVTNLPALGAGLNWWTGNLGMDGTITVNRSPVSAINTYSRGKGTTMKIFKSALTISDLDSGDSASYAGLVSAGSQGAAVSQDALAIYYEPVNDNSDTLQYRVTDQRGGTTTNTIQINVVSQEGQALTVVLSGSTATVGFAGIPGYSYQVQRSTNMTDWVTLVTTNAPPQGVFEWVDDFGDLGVPPADPPSSAYYRLEVP